MDIKDLDKKQLILLTLLITFVVSIATGIITVSLMKQMPTTVPQTINNVIQRTIEKVTTVENTTDKDDSNINEGSSSNSNLISKDGDILVPIYIKDTPLESNSQTDLNSLKEIGQGIIISDVGLILIDSSILTGVDNYIIVLNKIYFNVSVLKTFNNGFSILRITSEEDLNNQELDTGADTPSSDSKVDNTI